MDSILHGTALDTDCCKSVNEPESSTSIIKSRIKGNFSRILQQQSDTILALVGCVTQMNQVLLVQNQQLCNQSLKKNDDSFSDLIKHKMLSSLINESKQSSSPSESNDISVAMQQEGQFKQQQEQLRQQQLQKMSEELFRRHPQEWEQSSNNVFTAHHPINSQQSVIPNSSFPPSSVEQALGNNNKLPNPSLDLKGPLESTGLGGEAGKEFLRILIHSITGNPELFNKITSGVSKKMDEVKDDPSHPAGHDILLSKTEELKKAAQEVANKSLSKQDEDQLSQLAKRIEQHDNELKAQEIETFLQSGNDIDI